MCERIHLLDVVVVEGEVLRQGIAHNERSGDLASQWCELLLEAVNIWQNFVCKVLCWPGLNPPHRCTGFADIRGFV